MNIIVRTYGGQYLVRPDTTWEKDNEDFYPPMFVNELSYTPVLFARICKPGRSVGFKFADRYFDSISYGVLLYPENMIDGSPVSMATASMLDHTSFLTSPMFNRITLGQECNSFKLSCVKGGKDKKLFSCPAGTMEQIASALEEATKLIYIRVGDLLAIELDERKHLCLREDGDVNVKASWGVQSVLDFNIIM